MFTGDKWGEMQSRRTWLYCHLPVIKSNRQMQENSCNVTYKHSKERIKTTLLIAKKGLAHLFA